MSSGAPVGIPVYNHSENCESAEFRFTIKNKGKFQSRYLTGSTGSCKLSTQMVLSSPTMRGGR